MDSKNENAIIYRPLKAIRLKCLDCCAGQSAEVRLCPVTNCTLYPYRFGKRPKTIEKNATSDGTFEDNYSEI